MQPTKIKEFIPQESVEDKDRLLPAFLKIWNAPENLKYLSVTLAPFSQELVRTWLEHHKDNGGRYFCALDNRDEITGILVFKISPLDGCEIYGVGVDPKYKGKGIGRQLVEHAVCTAVSHGCRALDALVFADNAKMLRLLIAQGFVPVGMVHHKRADGADAVMLKKYLKDKG